MTNWNSRKTKSLASVPLWFENAIKEYQEDKKLSTFSISIMSLALESLIRHHDGGENEIIIFGDRNFESQEYDKFTESYPDESTENLLDFWQQKLKPPQHGGDRKSKKYREGDG